MIKLKRIKIPVNVDRTQLLGNILDGYMPDCICNNIACGEFNDYVPPQYNLDKLKSMLPPQTKAYQLEDLSKALLMDNVFNINKPGYGKTFETIMWIKLVLKKDFKALILCPKSVIETWLFQLKRWWPDYADCGAWWITNYEQLYNKQRLHTAQLNEWDVIVLDESHKIKSMKSKVTQAVFSLKSKHRHCLTGTPIKNRPEDLAAQLKWLDPYSITCYTDFCLAFCYMTRTPYGTAPRGLTHDKKMVVLLQKLLDMYCVGGKEHNIGLDEQPEYIKVKLKMDKVVAQLYKKTLGEYDSVLETRVLDTPYLLSKGIKVQNPIEQTTRLQQLTTCPQIFDKYENIKFNWIADWLEGTDEKVIIISKFAEAIHRLEMYLGMHGKHCYVMVEQRMSSTERREAVDYWKANKQALIGTFGLLGTGVDGLQEKCHYMIFLDRAWTASDNEQCEKRIWRTGQLKKPFFYILQCQGTIDVRIESIQKNKAVDAKALLQPGDDYDL